MRTGLPIAVLLAVLPYTAAAHVYYVGAGGDDGNPGTRERPWRSIERVNATRFAPGDSILFQAGGNFPGNLVLDERSRTSTRHPITIGSYGGTRATIAAGNGTAILVKNLGGIVVRDLVVRGSGAASNRGSGIEIRNTGSVAQTLQFVRVEAIEASGFRWAGIYVGGDPASGSGSGAVPQRGFRDVRIARSVAHGNLYYGIQVSGPFDKHPSAFANRDVTIADCLADNNAGDPFYTEKHSGSGILVENTDGAVIERCVAHDNGGNNGSLAGGPVGIWAHNANRVRIQSCVSYRNRTKGSADGGGFDLDGGVSNSVMQRNLSYDNDGPGYLVWNYRYAPRALQHIVVRDNISSGDARRHVYGGIHIGGDEPIRGIEVYRNTVVTNTAEARAVWVGGVPHGRIRFWNNVLLSSGPGVLVEISPGQKDVVFLGNAYWSRKGPFTVLDHGTAFASLDLWRSLTGQEMWKGRPRGVYAARPE